MMPKGKIRGIYLLHFQHSAGTFHKVGYSKDCSFRIRCLCH